MSVAESDNAITARLRWLRPEEGGRSEPPSGSRYSTVARFDETEEQWLKHAWLPFLDIRFARDSAGTQTGQTRIVSCDRLVSTTIYAIWVCQ
jgi:hypothetical protein